MHRPDSMVAAVAALGTYASTARAGHSQSPNDVGERFQAIERRVDGRLGVTALDPVSGRRLAWRPDERFPMCSTFKWLLAAQILSRVERGVERLERHVSYAPDDLLEYAPVAREHVSEGAMSVAALCAAAVEYSDNTAANLLLATVGGPGGFTAYLRSIGDDVTQLDRLEPQLNTAVPGDPRDTTTPAAMAENLRRVLAGDELTEPSRERLSGWLVGSKTGASKLRAGLPAHWRVGDKTGMGANGATNDVAIIWPAPGSPVFVAAYLTESTASVEERNGALAAVGKLVAERVSPHKRATGA